MQIREQLASDNFAVYAPHLARSLNNLSVHLREYGDRAGGLPAIAYAPALARSLNNLSIHLAMSGDRGGGLTTIHRATMIHEQLAKADFAAHADLACSLDNLSVHLCESGDRDGSAIPTRRAAQIREQLLKDGTPTQAVRASFRPLFDQELKGN